MHTWHAWGTTILRITLAIVYVMHGWLFAFMPAPSAFDDTVVRAGYPVGAARVFAWYVIAAHLLGGALLLIGFLTRPAALAQLPIVASSLFLVHWSEGFFMKTQGGGAEYAFVVLAATVALILLGPGAASIDHQREHGPRIEMP
ncbi:MAG TPA: DoxX family protein [Methylomirabilota bacterium]|jgi:putative oxidoreductase|nr:DoxX family protein [Methylomirabilota bacterium]